MDESGIPLSGWPAHVICKRGMKSPKSIIGGSGRENITVQVHVCVSGLGQFIPPYIYWARNTSWLPGPIGVSLQMAG